MNVRWDTPPWPPPPSGLRTKVGSHSVMAAQLRYLAELARSHKALIQVVRFLDGAHAPMGSMLHLLTFADAPPMAYSEGAHTGHLTDEPALVARHFRSYDLARAVAQPPEASLALIESAAEDHERQCQQKT
ncbi:Scr1 family TA system antitoxin-like transcriptional regulator [Streptomyces sp. NPDC004609]|uniref:Scr1 family TA system antitoxin-like transcriptional regulator n=1 Tax=Streptomyces sp. NPDC004609 TaxID=3364704 RepID=UPI0036D030FD